MPLRYSHIVFLQLGKGPSRSPLRILPVLRPHTVGVPSRGDLVSFEWFSPERGVQYFVNVGGNVFPGESSTKFHRLVWERGPFMWMTYNVCQNGSSFSDRHLGHPRTQTSTHRRYLGPMFEDVVSQGIHRWVLILVGGVILDGPVSFMSHLFLSRVLVGARLPQRSRSEQRVEVSGFTTRVCSDLRSDLFWLFVGVGST